MQTDTIDRRQQNEEQRIMDRGSPFSFNDEESTKLEDGRVTKVYFQRFLKFEQCCAFFNCVGLGHSVIVYDMEHEQMDQVIEQWLLWAIFVNTALLIVLTFQRYKSLLDWEHQRGSVPMTLNFMTSGYLFNYLLEVLILMCIPNYWCMSYMVEFYNEWCAGVAYYYLNEILCLIMVCRIVLVMRCLLVQTRWFNNRAQRVCGFYACEANYMFIVKSLMRTEPYIVIFSALICMVIVFGYAIRICESPLDRISAMMFNSYLNSFWYIIVTQVTLGYGDFYARTGLGRLIVLIVCIVGTFVISMMVVTLTNSLMTNSLESKAITVLQRILIRKKMIEEAGTIITIMAKIGISQRRGSLTQQQYKVYAIKLQDMLRRFKVTRRNYKSLQDNGSLLEEMNREFFLMREDFREISLKQDEIIAESDNILGMINPTKSKVKKE